jgi:hypothetical protein
MIRLGGSSGFTEPERNPSSLTMLGARQTCSASLQGDAGRGVAAGGGWPREVGEKAKGRPATACSLLRSVFARQQDGFVDEIQGDLRKRKITVFDGLGEHDAAIAVFAGERGGAVGIHRELPELKLLGRKALVAVLREGDFIDQPIGPACLCDVPHAVCVKNVAHHRVTIPVLASGELHQVGFGECFRISHGRSRLANRAIAASWGKRDRDHWTTDQTPRVSAPPRGAELHKPEGCGSEPR